MTSNLTINSGHYSEAGVKPVNEDACGIHVPDEPLLHTKGMAAVIADGVSGSEMGREASEACVRGFLNDYFSTPESWTVKTSGRRVLGALNRWLYGQGRHLPTVHSGMLTTLSVIVIKSTSAHIFHIGDSRIYRLRDNDLECLTRDHTLWMSEEKAFLSRAMGADVDVEIDYRCVPVEVNDIFILTTDGVHEHVSAPEINAFITDNKTNLDKATKTIVTHALEQGSQDNATCQIFQLNSLPQQEVNEFYQRLSELPFPPPLVAGMILDGYKILRELHSSTRTQIYLALDTDSDEKVVLKTPSVNYEDDAEYIDRFLHEEWIGRRISNPHILKVLELTRQRHFLYYVTEHLEGRTLRQWMNDNPQPTLQEVREIVEQIAAGLRAIHRLEMIHQDIKPENIFFDNYGTIKIIDFGSTRILGIDEIQTPLRHDSGLLGTLNYTAPEYFKNQSGSNRSDIFSFGVIVYEMLTGKLPYGKTDSIKAFSNKQYTPASQHESEIPAWVDAALEKAVQRNPQRRYELLSEFTYDLSHPNTSLLQKKHMPLLEKNPTSFWRRLAAVLFVVNIFLIYFLVR